LLRTELVPLLLLAALSLGASALAAPDSHAQAKAAFDQAQTQFHRGHFRSALEGYRKAYALAPLPALLYDAAQCERKLHRYADAERDYRRFLEASPNTSQRSLVLSLIEEMHAKAQLATLKRRSGARPEVARVDPTPAATPPTAPAPVPTEQGPAVVAQPLAAPPPVSDAPRAPSLLPSQPPQASALAVRSGAEVEPSTPLYKKWWFWGGVAVVAAGTATAIAVASHSSPATASLGQVDMR